jgi:hypothetical protein
MKILLFRVPDKTVVVPGVRRWAAVDHYPVEHVPFFFIGRVLAFGLIEVFFQLRSMQGFGLHEGGLVKLE